MITKKKPNKHGLCVLLIRIVSIARCQTFSRPNNWLSDIAAESPSIIWILTLLPLYTNYEWLWWQTESRTQFRFRSLVSSRSYCPNGGCVCIDKIENLIRSICILNERLFFLLYFRISPHRYINEIERISRHKAYFVPKIMWSLVVLCSIRLLCP